MSANNIKPVVSVILTSYNHEKFIKAAIDSVLNQSFQDFEFIIADDCSTDNSWALINSYNDPRIKLYRSDKTERGLINKVLKENIITGLYVAIHHSDDVWEGDKLAKQVEYLASNPGVAAVFTQASLINESGELFPETDENQTVKTYRTVFEKSFKSSNEWLNYFFHYGNCLCHPSLMIRKEVYDEMGYYNMNYFQSADYDYWIRLCLKKEIGIIEEPLIRFRVLQNSENTSSQTISNKIRSRLEYYQILNNFTSLTDCNEVIKIFPNIKQYHIFDKGLPLYLLARAAIISNVREAELFGLTILANLMKSQLSRQACLDLHNFTLKDYYRIIGNINPFNYHFLEEPATLNESAESLPRPSIPLLQKIISRAISDILWWKNNWKSRLG